MGRAGFTIFVLWGLTSLALSLPLFAVPSSTLVIGLCALAVTWWTRFSSEGLGVAVGCSCALVLAGMVEGEAFAWVAAGILLAAAGLVWRVRLAVRPAAEADEADGASKPWRLVLGAALLATVLLPVQFILYLGFGFAHCASDTTPEPPVGSDLAHHCDFIDDHLLLLVLGPPLAVLVLGIVLARMRQPLLLLVATLVVVALTIGMHIPDWTLG